MIQISRDPLFHQPINFSYHRGGYLAPRLLGLCRSAYSSLRNLPKPRLGLHPLCSASREHVQHPVQGALSLFTACRSCRDPCNLLRIYYRRRCHPQTFCIMIACVICAWLSACQCRCLGSSRVSASSTMKPKKPRKFYDVVLGHRKARRRPKCTVTYSA